MTGHPVATVCHRVRGRTRIRVPARKGDQAFFVRVGEMLGEHPGIESVTVNGTTASILLAHADDISVADIEKFASEKLLFQLQDQPGPSSARVQAAGGYEKLDSWLKQITDGEFDYQSVLLVIFVVMTVSQIMRGKLMAPAASMLWYVVGVIENSKRK